MPLFMLSSTRQLLVLEEIMHTSTCVKSPYALQFPFSRSKDIISSSSISKTKVDSQKNMESDSFHQILLTLIYFVNFVRFIPHYFVKTFTSFVSFWKCWLHWKKERTSISVHFGLPFVPPRVSSFIEWREKYCFYWGETNVFMKRGRSGREREEWENVCTYECCKRRDISSFPV